MGSASNISFFLSLQIIATQVTLIVFDLHISVLLPFPKNTG